MMRIRIHAAVAVIVCLLLPAAAAAQNREHLQLTADLRMVQEQVSQLQLTVNQLAEALKTTNARLDGQAEANTKGFANEQVLINQMATTVNTIREKLDDNMTRVSQVTQEVSSIREGLQMLTNQINSLVSLLQPPPDPTAAAAGEAPSPPSSGGGDASGAAAAQPAATPPLGNVSLPESPSYIYSQALGDYYAARYDSAIEGFRELLQKFPDAADAANAQFQIGESYYALKRWRDAIPEYAKVISTYPQSEHLAEAYYMQGVCYLALNQRTNAQKMFETVIKQYPDSTQALMAQQTLQGMGTPKR